MLLYLAASLALLSTRNFSHQTQTKPIALTSIDRNLPDISPRRLRFITEHLAAMVNRNTSTDHLKRAAEWVATQYRTIPGLEVTVFPYQIHQGPRIPADKTTYEVMAILPGQDDERVLMGGHLDSINIKAPHDIETLETARAPGADDDLSGMASTMETARVMAQHKWKHTLVFFAFSGEEQGLFGSAAFAKYAKDNNWKILGFFNNDIIGSGHNEIGQRNDHLIRLYSAADPNGHGSRNLAQYAEWLNACHPLDKGPLFNQNVVHHRDHPDFKVELELLADRYLRGGDHFSFNRQGYAAVRFTEPYESFTHQHTPYDLPSFVDFNYEANAARVNLLCVSALAQEESLPIKPRIKLNLGHDTLLSWQGNPNQTYIVYWRATTSAVWQHSIRVRGLNAHISRVSKDDYFFAVGPLAGPPVDAH